MLMAETKRNSTSQALLILPSPILAVIAIIWYQGCCTSPQMLEESQNVPECQSWHLLSSQFFLRITFRTQGCGITATSLPKQHMRLCLEHSIYQGQWSRINMRWGREEKHDFHLALLDRIFSTCCSSLQNTTRCKIRHSSEQIVTWFSTNSISVYHSITVTTLGTPQYRKECLF